jgi:hypothetical protein
VHFEVSALLRRHGLALVVGTAVVSVLLRLWIAASTFGSDDVHYWTQFAAGVRHFGPVGIYGHSFDAQYNHPPLAGWMLLLIDHLQRTGLSFAFLVRVPASVADGITGVLLFLLIDRYGGRQTAVPAAMTFMLSPVAVIVSGFHGNTDPVFVMLALAAFYQEKVRRRHGASGVLLALAISVKIVPVVLLPLFVLRLVSGGARGRTRFIAGGALVFAVLWLPVLVSRPEQFVENVVLYSGSNLGLWGAPVLVFMLGVDPTTHQAAFHALSYVALAVSAFLPVLLARRSTADLQRFGLVLSLFLLLSPAFGMQYLVWGLAAAFLVSLRHAAAYALASSAFALVVYSLWNHALPWNWYEARSFDFPDFVVLPMFAAWLALLAVVLRGVAVLHAGGVADTTPVRRTGSSVRPAA